MEARNFDDLRHDWLSLIAIIESASEIANDKIRNNLFSDDERKMYFDMVDRNLHRLRDLLSRFEKLIELNPNRKEHLNHGKIRKPSRH